MLDVPVGTIVATILNPNSLPPGWLPCDGSPIPGQYSQLITALGSTNTPNLIGRVLLGAGDLTAATLTQSDGRNPAFGAIGTALEITDTGGECQVVISIQSMPRHNHQINGGNFGLHKQSFEGDSGNDIPYETNPDGSTLTGTDYTGENAPTWIVQPYYAVTYMICAGTD
ncbi:tail fiber protein [Nonomuraea sp. NPDC050790]|uniref:tail fiber protein n=1 Tax=Nonomuraea sp. NPDC050790 TaxID=3364371 RepID=UPI00378E4677